VLLARKALTNHLIGLNDSGIDRNGSFGWSFLNLPYVGGNVTRKTVGAKHPFGGGKLPPPPLSIRSYMPSCEWRHLVELLVHFVRAVQFLSNDVSEWRHVGDMWRQISDTCVNWVIIIEDSAGQPGGQRAWFTLYLLTFTHLHLFTNHQLTNEAATSEYGARYKHRIITITTTITNNNQDNVYPAFIYSKPQAWNLFIYAWAIFVSNCRTSRYRNELKQIRTSINQSSKQASNQRCLKCLEWQQPFRSPR